MRTTRGPPLTRVAAHQRDWVALTRNRFPVWALFPAWLVFWWVRFWFAERPIRPESAVTRLFLGHCAVLIPVQARLVRVLAQPLLSLPYVLMCRQRRDGAWNEKLRCERDCPCGALIQTCQTQKWVGCVRGGLECEASPSFFLCAEWEVGRLVRRPWTIQASTCL